MSLLTGLWRITYSRAGSALKTNSMGTNNHSADPTGGRGHGPDCEALQDGIAGLVLGELAAEEAAVVRSHIRTCPACAEAERQYRKLAAALQEHAAEEPLRSPHFVTLAGSLHDAVRRVRRSQARRPMVALKVAAVLLLAVGLAAVGVRHLCARRGAAVFRIAWRQEGIAPLEGGMHLYPLVRGRTLLALEAVGGALRVVALERATGVRQWSTPFAVWEPFQADARRLYVWSPAGDEVDLVALDHGTGRELWRCRRPGVRGLHAPALVVVAGGVAWDEQGTVRFVEAETGRLRWSQPLTRAGRVSLAADGKSGLFAATPEATVALRVTDGALVWRHSHVGPQAEQPVGALVACGSAGVCVALRYPAFQGRLLNLDPISGDCRWSRPIGMPLSVQTTREQVVVRSALLEMYDGRTGRRMWRADVPGCAPVAVADGKIYVPGGKTRPAVWLLDGRTGRRLGSQPLVSSCTGLVIDGQCSYLSGNDGVLYAMQAGG